MSSTTPTITNPEDKHDDHVDHRVQYGMVMIKDHVSQGVMMDIDIVVYHILSVLVWLFEPPVGTHRVSWSHYHRLSQLQLDQDYKINTSNYVNEYGLFQIQI